MNSPQPALQVTALVFALYPVTDMARARKFYGETLGLKMCMEMELAPGKWWVEYDVGGPSALAITNFESPGANVGKSSGIALEVANYDEALAHLRGAGVAVTWGPNEFPACHCFAVEDPDGNDLYIHRRKAHALPLT